VETLILPTIITAQEEPVLEEGHLGQGLSTLRARALPVDLITRRAVAAEADMAAVRAVTEAFELCGPETLVHIRQPIRQTNNGDCINAFVHSN